MTAAHEPSSCLRAHASASQPNRLLAFRMKEIAPSESVFVAFKQLAREFQVGNVSPTALKNSFEKTFGKDDGALALFLEMAENNPSAERRAELLATLSDDASNMISMENIAPVPRQRNAPNGNGDEPNPNPFGEAMARSSEARTSRKKATTAAFTHINGKAAAHSAVPSLEVQEPAGVVPLRHQGAPASSSAPLAAFDGAVPQGGWGRGVVLWLRKDLRLNDNPALVQAARLASSFRASLTICYIDSPEEDGAEPMSDTGSASAGRHPRGAAPDGGRSGARASQGGLEVLGVPRDHAASWRGSGVASWGPRGATRVWQREALRELDRGLVERYGPGARIVFLRGPYLPALLSLLQAVGGGHVVLSRRYETSELHTDAEVAGALAGHGIGVHACNTFLLHEPWEIRVEPGRGKSGTFGHFGTLTPFLRACVELGPLGKPLLAPETLPVPEVSRDLGLSLEELQMVPLPTSTKTGKQVDWVSQILRSWPSGFGERAALSALDAFIVEGMRCYEKDRGFADGRAVSRLSPYLHFGQLSPRLMGFSTSNDAQMRKLDAAGCKETSKTFWRRLIWRDLAYWQLWHWPDMCDRPIRPAYAHQEWNADEDVLAVWQMGKTGYPTVDAGMRELWVTGWMHQNVRMAAASFLIEVLHVDWRRGAEWFHVNLCDADAAINSMMWQNAGKSGLDQWNFSVGPGTASSFSLDPTGEYIRKWVPELKHIPNKYIHEPWNAPPGILERAKVQLGVTYPHRVTGPTSDLSSFRRDHIRAVRAARARALAQDVDHGGYDCIPVPRASVVLGSEAHRAGRVRVYTAPVVRGMREEMFNESAWVGKEKKRSGERDGEGRRAKKGGSREEGGRGGKGGRGRGRGKSKLEGVNKMDTMQRTLDEYVRRGAVDWRVDDEML